MPLQATSGAASYDAFGGGVAVVPNYIEDVFSTWLYTGNGSTQTITNGIDLAGKGGMTWIKYRNSDSYGTNVFDTVRGVNRSLRTNSTAAQNLLVDTLTAFNNNGFSLGNNNDALNFNGGLFTSWTFREQPKFFDVVTYSGSNSLQNIQHNLGSVPGCIFIKRTNDTGSWFVYHRSLGADKYMTLNTTSAEEIDNTIWNNTSPTSTQFTVKGGLGPINESGGTYVAYLFAHNAGGFGLTGTDNVISCGSVSGFGTVVNLGFEPQWILMKQSNGTSDWIIADNMRGIATGGSDALLFANTSGAETSANDWIDLTSTGFVNNVGSGTFIYIAIRRGPMRTPTTGTSVFAPVVASNAQGTKNTTNFPIDMQLALNRNGSITNYATDRLRGVSTTSTSSGQRLITSSTSQEQASTSTQAWDNTGFQTAADWAFEPLVYENFRRAPGFFDEVCYTGTGVNRTVAHNLGVVPELVIIKQRNAATDWWVIDYPLNGTLQLNNPYPINSPIPTNLSTGATATTFSLGTYSQVNGSGGTYVAYLFATCAGVSKVGSYTGTGTTQVINCGFTGGARFVMIKRADDTGLYTEGWYVWDSARGIVAGNDPYLLLNSTAAEVTNTDFIDTASTGFEISSTAPAAINASGGTYIFLAIA